MGLVSYSHDRDAHEEASMTNLEEPRSVRRDVVDAHKARMLAETRGWSLRELRENLGLTQVELATQLDVSQDRVSRIERGAIHKIQLGTLRRYVEALGWELLVEVQVGDQSFRIA